MKNKDNSVMLLGLLAFASTATFLYLSKGKELKAPLEGLNIDIDPDKLIDSALTRVNSDENTKRIVGNIAKSSISKLIG